MIDYAKIYEYSQEYKTSITNNIDIDNIMNTVSTTAKHYINDENIDICCKQIKKMLNV